MRDVRDVAARLGISTETAMALLFALLENGAPDGRRLYVCVPDETETVLRQTVDAEAYRANADAEYRSFVEDVLSAEETRAADVAAEASQVDVVAARRDIGYTTPVDPWPWLDEGPTHHMPHGEHTILCGADWRLVAFATARGNVTCPECLADPE